MDVAVKSECESDSDDAVPLPKDVSDEVCSALKTELEEYHVEDPLALASSIPHDVKCEYESDPEYDDQIRKITSDQQHATASNEMQEAEALLRLKPLAPIKPYRCKLCGKGFDVISILAKHISTHARKKTVYGEILNKKNTKLANKSPAKKDVKTTKGKEEKKKANQKKSKNTKVTQPRPWSLLKNVVLMKIIPSSERLQYRCTDCRVGFKELIDLSRHIRKAKAHARTFEKFVCGNCFAPFKGYRNMAEIKKHLQSHTGVHPEDVTLYEYEYEDENKC